MADSTVTDVSKMKVVELRKELKSRGLSYAGDKAELVARLQTAMSQDDHGDINLDWDLDSDGVLEDEDEKSQTDILDDPVTDNVSSEELALNEHSSPPKPAAEEAKPQRTLKRKITMSDKDKSQDKPADNKEAGAKKIILNRSTSVTSIAPQPAAEKTEEPTEKSITTESSNKVKITADIDPKTRLELRAKRFGLPVKVSDAERKEARKQRFGQNTSAISSETGDTGSLSENLDKLKKRADRFGQSVSKIMTDIENKERIEKRKAKFGTAK